MRRFLLALGILFVASRAAATQAPFVELARHGEAKLPIVISADGSDSMKALAGTLAGYLERISKATFAISVGDGRHGIALGTAADFPVLGLADKLAGEGFEVEEQYLLRSHEAGLQLIGASEVAVRHAVWDLLYRLGYRHFFPGEVWEVVPKTDVVHVAVDVIERPDYASRRIWYGFGASDYNEEPWQEWQIHNRAASAFELRSGHAYDQILRQYADEFREHPEYLGLVGGRRTSSKFCTSNPGLRELVVRYAMDYFNERPEETCVSVEPSDGGGWCECEACVEMGSPSDRALTLANDVSAALEAHRPGRYVALYAYNQHSPPPKIRARPRVIVNVATSFIRGGYTMEDLLAGWKGQGVERFGIREYYSVNTWDRDLPHSARGGDLEYLARTIPAFHAQGARFMSAESSDNWGPNGLGYYLAARMLWDVGEASHVEALTADFLQKAFGAAQAPMAEYYRLLHAPDAPLMSHDLLGRMYRSLGEAASINGDRAIAARIDQLVLYTRYVELFRAYQLAEGESRQAAFEQLIRHVYRMRRTMMVHAKALIRDLPNRDKAVRLPSEARWETRADRNPWLSDASWTRSELDGMVEQGIAVHKTISARPMAFSTRLKPAGGRLTDSLPVLDDSQSGRGEQEFWTWFDSPGTLQLEVTGGLIAHYRDRGDVKIVLAAVEEGGQSPVDHAAVPPDGTARTVTLRTTRSGLHRLTVNDGNDRTAVVWPEGFPRTIEISQRYSPGEAGRRSGYFYVPRGTVVVAGYGSPAGRGEIRVGGKPVFRFDSLDGPDYFEIAVENGMDGKLWSFHGVAGRFVLLTVPPYSARHPRELLLPKEIVGP
ncbi:MAG: DUF4838 domain-containing protein [Thermoguttaceae bacterium]|nr:DUF4838 domain-containing protein [Thermoguttaceae bacterium]